jgi:hypothetical protein
MRIYIYHITRTHIPNRIQIKFRHKVGKRTLVFFGVQVLRFYAQTAVLGQLEC